MVNFADKQGWDSEDHYCLGIVLIAFFKIDMSILHSLWYTWQNYSVIELWTFYNEMWYRTWTRYIRKFIILWDGFLGFCCVKVKQFSFAVFQESHQYIIYMPMHWLPEYVQVVCALKSWWIHLCMRCALSWWNFFLYIYILILFVVHSCKLGSIFKRNCMLSTTIDIIISLSMSKLHLKQCYNFYTEIKKVYCI